MQKLLLLLHLTLLYQIFYKNVFLLQPSQIILSVHKILSLLIRHKTTVFLQSNKLMRQLTKDQQTLINEIAQGNFTENQQFIIYQIVEGLKTNPNLEVQLAAMFNQ